MLHFSNDERICGTCAHYGQALAVTVLLPEGSPAGSGPRLRAPCLCHAVEPDAGFGAVVLLGPESHCRCHADAWQRYLRLTRLAGTAPYTELVESAELQVPFAAGSLTALSHTIHDWIKERQI